MGWRLIWWVKEWIGSKEVEIFIMDYFFGKLVWRDGRDRVKVRGNNKLGKYF